MNKKIIQSIGWLFLTVISLSLFYNIFVCFFAVRPYLAHDEAEYLHVAYLLSLGERPFVDFLENHPLLFSHCLWWMHELLEPGSIKKWALLARIITVFHFFLCVLVFYLWVSQLIKCKPPKWLWVGMFVSAWAMMGIYSPIFDYIWHIRPDFICYAYTSLSLYLIFNIFQKDNKNYTSIDMLQLTVAGVLIGLGNAILPKGIIIVLPILLTTVIVKRIPKCSIDNFDYHSLPIKEFCVVVVTALITFLIAMLIDCKLSQIGLEQWIDGVFLLNTRKHILYTLREDNPITSLIEAFSLSYILIVFLLLWFVWELIYMKQNQGKKTLLIFALFTIAINLLLAPYTNGVTFSYYFIPSFFGIAAIYIVVFVKIYEFMEQQSINTSFLQKALLLFIISIIIIQLTKQPAEAFFLFQNRQFRINEVISYSPDDYVPDAYFPKNYQYLTRNPQDIPVMSRHWGYHYMLSHSSGFWTDNYLLHLGPNPQEIWGGGFGKKPPDAFTFTGLEMVEEFIFMLKKCQNLDTRWLLDEIKINYTLMRMRNKFVSLYIRNDHIPEMRKYGWITVVHD